MRTGNTYRGRRTFLKGVVGTAGAFSMAGCVGLGGGGGFPEDGSEIEMHIPYGTGGGYDTVFRGLSPFVAQAFTETQDVNVNIVPRNVTGGAGVRMLNEQYRRDPGGEVLGGLNAPPHVINQILDIAGPEYDVLDFVSTAAVEANTASVVTRNELDVSGWDDMLAKAEEDGEWNLATSGVGAQTHVTFSILSEETGIPANFVHFESIGEAMNAVSRGEGDYAVSVTGSALPFLGDDSTDMKFLFVLNGEPPVIDVPGEIKIASEEGVPRWEIIRDLTAGRKLPVLPPETSDEVADIWEEVLTTATSKDDFKEWAAANGRPVVSWGRDRARETLESQVSSVEEVSDFLGEIIK